jgi:hypothetical protein
MIPYHELSEQYLKFEIKNINIQPRDIKLVLDWEFHFVQNGIPNIKIMEIFKMLIKNLK